MNGWIGEIGGQVKRIWSQRSLGVSSKLASLMHLA